MKNSISLKYGELIRLYLFLSHAAEQRAATTLTMNMVFTTVRNMKLLLLCVPCWICCLMLNFGEAPRARLETLAGRIHRAGRTLETPEKLGDWPYLLLLCMFFASFRASFVCSSCGSWRLATTKSAVYHQMSLTSCICRSSTLVEMVPCSCKLVKLLIN